jgi:hypothetical protein
MYSERENKTIRLQPIQLKPRGGVYFSDNRVPVRQLAKKTPTMPGDQQQPIQRIPLKKVFGYGMLGAAGLLGGGILIPSLVAGTAAVSGAGAMMGLTAAALTGLVHKGYQEFSGGIGGAPRMTLKGTNLKKLAEERIPAKKKNESIEEGAPEYDIATVEEDDRDVQETLRQWHEHAKRTGKKEHAHQIGKMRKSMQGVEMTVARAPDGSIQAINRSQQDGSTIYNRGTVANPSEEYSGAGKALMQHSAKKVMRSSGSVILNAGNKNAEAIWGKYGFEKD